MEKIITKIEKETFELAKKMSSKLQGGEIIALNGELGAGKTIFTKGLADGLGVKKTITSPTFVIMKVYGGIRNQESGQAGIRQLVHIDAYRLQSGADLEAIGALDYFERKDTVTVVEWAERIENILPKKVKSINITIDNNKRIIKTNL